MKSGACVYNYACDETRRDAITLVKKKSQRVSNTCCLFTFVTAQPLP